ncbi:hypothetical protein IJ707_07780 [bacterium]|nr:hypothetical protein [bacterium]
MSKQFEQLEILYKQILTVSNNIKTSIDKDDYDELLSQEAYKAQLISRVNLAKKTIKLSDEEAIEINNLRNEILSQEKENLEKIQLLRDKTLAELKSLNSQNKITNKYEQIEAEEGTICDYTSD